MDISDSSPAPPLRSEATCLVAVPVQDSPAPGAIIRVGILLDGRRQEAWVHRALQLALAVPGVQLVAVALVNTRGRSGPAARLHRLVDRLDRRLRCARDPLLARVDVVAALDGVALLEIPLLRPGAQWLASPRGVAVLRDARADVWLCCCADAPQAPFPSLCRLGIWGLEIGAQVPAANRWAGAPEVAARSNLTVSQVVDYTQPGRNVVYRAWGTTIRNSAGRNRLVALRKAASLFARSLRAARRELAEAGPPSMEPLKRGMPEATIPGVARLCWRLVAEVLAGRTRALLSSDQWHIGYYFANEDSDAAYAAAHMRRLVPPRNHDWADPFIVHRDGRSFIFFEDLPHRRRRAHIAAVEVFEDGSAGEPRRVLERPYHLSYPFIFPWMGELFMMPETGDNRTVEVYRCERFPDRWTLHKVLLENIAAFDATLVREAGRWWMFVNVAEPGADPNEELHLYWSDSPLGPWTAHVANPVLSDVRRARGAGPLFRRDGVLYRPSQDCSAAYGSAISINRVDVLGTERYQETPVGRMDPDRAAGMRCMHTFGAAGRLRVVDFIMRRSRWSRA